MAQNGFTPIKIYSSSTAAAAPLAANLDNTNGSELAINIADGKLYYKDNAGVVKVLASNAGSLGDVVGPASSVDGALTAFDGTSGKLVKNANLTANNVVIGNGTGAPLFVAPGASGNILSSNGTTWTSTPLPAGGLTYIFTTTALTAVDKQGVLTDTSGGSFTVTLPATPTVGAQVVVADAGASWGTNNLTVARNGETIGGLAENLICDITGASVQFVYDGTNWEVYAQIGGNGGNAVTLNGTQTLTNKTINIANNTLTGVQPTLVSGTSIKTVNSTSLLGSGDVAVQPTLVSGTNIKTINGGSVLGSGDIATGGITLGTPVNTTSGTSVDYTGIPAGTKRITVNFSGVSTNGTTQIAIQLGDSGGIEESSYLSLMTRLADGSTVSSTTTSNGFSIYSTTAAAVLSGSVVINLENSTTFTWCASGIVGSTGALLAQAVISGRKSLSAELDRIRITAGGFDTFDAGQVNISFE